MISNSISHRWNPSPEDTTCKLSSPRTASGLLDGSFFFTGRVNNEDDDRRFQQLAGSVHNVGMALDMVQTDVIQLNGAMKEASTDCKSRCC